MYKLTDVLDVDSMQTRQDMNHIIGKDFDVEGVEVGKKATLNNVSDSHIYRNVTKTSILNSVRESFKEVYLVAQDTMYILKKY